MNRKKWDKLKAKRDKIDRKMEDAFLEGSGANSRCPKCKQWEHQGIIIAKQEVNDLIHMTCRNCDHSWDAIWGPMGMFIYLEAPEIPEETEEAIILD